MPQQLLTKLSALHAEILNLNEYLKEDQKILPKRQTDIIEQADSEKLGIRNKIEELIQSLHQHSEWPELKKAAEAPADHSHFQAHLALWQKIQTAFDQSQELIDTNQRVIENSMAYYTRVFHNIVQVLEDNNDEPLLYEKKGSSS